MKNKKLNFNKSIICNLSKKQLSRIIGGLEQEIGVIDIRTEETKCDCPKTSGNTGLKFTVNGANDNAVIN